MMIQRHGHWSPYVPQVWPPGLPSYIAFCRRDEDGVDWYEFRETMAAETVKMTIMLHDGRQVVQVANRDVSRLFPVGALLIEVDGIDDADPQAVYGQRAFLADDDAFGNVVSFFPNISDRQFFQALATKGAITQEEALAAVKTGEVPSAFHQLIQSVTDPQEQFDVRMLLSGATQFERRHPLVNNFGHALGWSDQEIDDLWHTAAKL